MSAGLSVWPNLFTFYKYYVDSKAIFTQVILECNVLTFVVSYHSLPIVLIVNLEMIRYVRRVEKSLTWTRGLGS